jgi:hypothetical protein
MAFIVDDDLIGNRKAIAHRLAGFNLFHLESAFNEHWWHENDRDTIPVSLGPGVGRCCGRPGREEEPARGCPAGLTGECG